MKKQISILLIISMLAVLLCGCAKEAAVESGENEITLSDTGILLNGCEVKEDTEGVFISHDVIYYEDRDSYDDGFAYGEGSDADKHSAEAAAASARF